MPEKMIVFIDYQNAYMRARACFHESASHHSCGQFDPLKLGLQLAELGKGERELFQVRVYCGLPSNEHDPRGYSARQRQIAAWKRDPRIEVIARPLHYPLSGDGQPREKGVDVSLAIDFVRLAIEGQYEVGVLMSNDTDLKPALECVWDMKGVRPEVAAWRHTSSGHQVRLSIKDRKPFCLWLPQDSYMKCGDWTDYVSQKSPFQQR